MKRELELKEIDELELQQQLDCETLSCRGLGRKKRDLPVFCDEIPTPEQILQLKDYLISELGVTKPLGNLEYGDLIDLAETYGALNRMSEQEKKLRGRLVKLGCANNLDGFECRDLESLLEILEGKQKIEILNKKEKL